MDRFDPPSAISFAGVQALWGGRCVSRPAALSPFRESFNVSTGKPCRSSNFMGPHLLEAYPAEVDALRRFRMGPQRKDLMRGGIENIS